ncbi:hypothetical protein [Leptothrix discophora]|uniref:Capsule assembly Wzi family protein n=1 Tax=Leptothrix discophora TaxID=89 RepID=A0ABT9G776_LEPDI|nr:hypothetical protein [Leptothrix discophora]MDP4302338.1 hypothetical protein [Leptothrix discophora]
MTLPFRPSTLALPLAALLQATVFPAAAAEGWAAIPLRASLGLERVELPGREGMGLVSGALLFEAADDWFVGPAVYGAASGQRGGFFVGGLQVERDWRFGGGRSLTAGLYAGGGGGAAAPVGGGLMLRPALTLWQRVGPGWQAGLSASQVSFPSGDIRSRQLGVVLAWDGVFRHLDATAGPAGPGRSGLGLDRMSGMLTDYGIETAAGARRRIGLVGARAERVDASGAWRWGIESAAAARGDAAGYMEILATGAASWAPLPQGLPTLRGSLRLSAGLGGGGSVPTGGGPIGRLVAGLQASPAEGWTVGIEAGELRGLGSPLRARVAGAWLAFDLERPDAAASLPVRTDWSGALLRYTGVRRNDGRTLALDTVGLKLNRYVGEHVYLSGQAHSAYAGQAGAYSIGLIGAGVSGHPVPGWQLGAEALAGAAGGGGVATGGGMLMQGVLWAGWQPSGGIGEWRVGIGQARTRQGGLSTPLVELGWARRFDLGGR